MIDGEDITAFVAGLTDKLENRFGRPAAVAMAIIVAVLLVGATFAVTYWSSI